MRKIATLLVGAAIAFCAAAEENIEYSADLTAIYSTGRYAPQYISAHSNGKYVTGKSIYLGGKAIRPLDLNSRFSWSYGAEFILGYSNALKYDRYQSTAEGLSEWHTLSTRPAAARLIQLFGKLKYRQVYLTIGMQQSNSVLMDNPLSIGDIVRSDNARPIPGVSAGFLDFVDIPFTFGWVQINGEIMYGRMTDNGFKRKQFNHYQGLLATDLYYTYKRCYFRFCPSQPLSVTAGMQAAGMFGGMSQWYQRGQLIRSEVRGFHLRDLWDMFFPMEGSGEGYYKGSSLGSWDFKAHYRFNSGNALNFYFEWPWEDGSSIGRRNGWDGVWGLSFDFAHKSPVKSIVLEYVDFTNHCGPIHHTAADYPGTTLTSEANGGDNYWNNDFYGAYANYGMAIGTPFLIAPIYNSDGYPLYAHNRTRGFHAAACGSSETGVTWRTAVGYRIAGGQGRLPAPRRLHCFSAMAEATWTPAADVMPGLALKAQAAFDVGNLVHNTYGICVAISYSGNFSLGKQSLQ